MFSTSNKNRSRHFEEQVAPHLNYLRNLARRLCHNSSDVEDVMQDALIKLFRSIDRWASADNPRPYFARTVYNQYIDHIRRQSRHNKVGDFDDELHPSEPNPGNRPDMSTDHEITLDRLRLAMAQLSPMHRAIIVLHDIEGFTYQEISEMEGIPLGTSKSRHNRARKALAGLL